VSKIAGLHLNDWPDGAVEYIRDTQPGWVKSIAQDRDKVERAKAESPETQFIGRMHREIEDQKRYFNRQEEGAEQYFRDLSSQGLWPVVDVWEGINEPGPHPKPEMYRFWMRLAQLMNDAGKQLLIHGTSVGTWAGSESDPFHDDRSTWIHESAKLAGAIHKHEYCAPHMRSEFMWNPNITERQGGFYTLRYRQAYTAMPPDARVPLYITECGIDSGINPPWNIPAQGGWRSFTTARDYVNQLQWYLECCKEDGYVKAVIPFCTFALDPTWDTYSMWDGEIRELWGEVLAEEDGEEMQSGWVDMRGKLPLGPIPFPRLPQDRFDEVVIHHSGDEVHDIWDIKHHHVVNNGWYDTGYHAVIGKDGVKYRNHDWNVQAAHTYGENGHTVGVCFIGNLNHRWPTDAQLAAAREVLGVLPFEFSIKGHRDYGSRYGPTECPGNTFDEWRHLLLEEEPEPPNEWEERALTAEDKLDRIERIVEE